jgi:predicted RND superfamily exporter protein
MATLVLILIATPLSLFVEFDHDVRNMLTMDESEILMNEMHMRYEVSGDPMAIASDSIGEAAALWEHVTPLTDDVSETVSQIVSIFSFLPHPAQQVLNYRKAQKFKKESSEVTEKMVPKENRKNFKKFMEMLDYGPYTFDEIPAHLKKQFQNRPGSKHKGWLTFIYPKVHKIFNAKNLKFLDNAVGQIEYPLIGKHTWEYFRLMAQDELLGKQNRVMASRQVSKSEIDKKALNIVNTLSDQDLDKTGLFPLTKKTILEGRPFKTVASLFEKTKTAITTGSTLMVAHFTYIVQKESEFIIKGSLILVVFILFLCMRRFGATTLVLFPLATGVLFSCALMAMTGVKLNYFNIAVLPLILGYSIDSSIFIYYRFIETGSVSEAVGKTGSAVITSSLTTLFALGTLSLADHPGLQSMGHLASIGIFVTIISNLILLPALLYFLKEKRSRFLPAQVYQR